jgi:hypothetical protein
MEVEMFSQLSQRHLALDGGKRHFRLEGRCVVPAGSSAHGPATVPGAIAELADQMLRDPAKLSVTPVSPRLTVLNSE